MVKRKHTAFLICLTVLVTIIGKNNPSSSDYCYYISVASGYLIPAIVLFRTFKTGPESIAASCWLHLSLVNMADELWFHPENPEVWEYLIGFLWIIPFHVWKYWKGRKQITELKKQGYEKLDF